MPATIEDANTFLLLQVNEVPYPPGTPPAELARACAEIARRLVRRTLRDEDACEQLAEQAGRIALEKMSARGLSFPDAQAFRAYFKKAAAGALADHYARHPTLLGLGDVALGTQLGEVEQAEVEPDAIARMAWEIVDRVLAAKHRVPLTLRLAGWKYDEIADVLEHNRRGYVHRRIGEALRELRRTLATRGVTYRRARGRA